MKLHKLFKIRIAKIKNCLTWPIHDSIPITGEETDFNVLVGKFCRNELSVATTGLQLKHEVTKHCSGMSTSVQKGHVIQTAILELQHLTSNIDYSSLKDFR